MRWKKKSNRGKVFVTGLNRRHVVHLIESVVDDLNL